MRKSSFFLEETEDIFTRQVHDPQENQQVPQAPGALEEEEGGGGGVGWGPNSHMQMTAGVRRLA